MSFQRCLSRGLACGDGGLLLHAPLLWLQFHSQYKSKGQASFQDVKSGAARCTSARVCACFAATTDPLVGRVWLSAAVKGAATVAQTDAFKEAAAGAARSAVQHSLENPAPSQSKPTGSNPFGV